MSEPNQPTPRRRFVIPFTGSGKKSDYVGDPAEAPRPGKKGGGCLKFLIVGLIIAIVIAVAAGIGGYLYWQNYQTRPGYSVALMFDAALNNDQDAFDKMVDTDRVANSLSDQVTAKALSLYPGEVPPDIRKQVEDAVRNYLPTVKERAHKELVPEISKKGERLKGYPFPVMALAVPWVMKIEQDGDKAIVTAPPETGGGELTMERNGDRWRVVGVKDDAAVARILTQIMSQLPDILKGKLPINIPKIPGVN